jgi:two-component system KDP operon response regulator KdpE
MSYLGTDPSAPNVLVIDDEIQIRRFLRAGFELEGFSVHDAKDAAEALRAATLQTLDLIILDLALPDLDGAEVLERLRAWSNIPVIVLSVRSSEAEKVRLLELGADDYVVKPFGMAELLARARAALRRHSRELGNESVVTIDGLKIDFSARAVFLNDERLSLTPKEYRLLQILAQHADNVVTHQQLLKDIWGGSHVDDIHYLRIFVRKLRRKIEKDPNRPRILLTELGVGYRLAVPGDASARIAD